MDTTTVENMNFCVSFLTATGETDSEMDRLWVSGNVMTGLLSHSNRKVKYVFDKTVVMKDGWLTRDLVSQARLSQG